MSQCLFRGCPEEGTETILITLPPVTRCGDLIAESERDREVVICATHLWWVARMSKKVREGKP